MRWIEEEIRIRGGAVPFREFMELALYHPVHGYYATGGPRVGRKGDYLTAPTASRWYAAVVARVAGRLAERLGAPLTVVDAGSGTGEFLADLAEAWTGAGLPRDGLRRVSVERSPVLQRRQRERLPADVTVVSRIEDIPELESPVLIHASELYDALPVHRVVQRGDGLRELWIRAAESGLTWEEHPAPDELAAYLQQQEVRLEEGQLAEISPRAEAFHRSLLTTANAPAAVVVLDYGYPARRLYDPRGRRRGSLACYRGHRLSRDPLAAPGEQDITAHVNWDDLRRAAAEVGWEDIALVPLAEFLVRGGLEELVQAAGLGIQREIDAEAIAERQELKRLLDPDGMGSDLKVLLQATPDAAPDLRLILSSR